MPLRPDEWHNRITNRALDEQIEEHLGEDALAIVRFLRENPQAYTAREIFYAVFDPGPVRAGFVTEEELDDGSTVEKSETRDFSDKHEDGIEKVREICRVLALGKPVDGVDTDSVVVKREVKTTDGMKAYFRYPHQ